MRDILAEWRPIIDETLAEILPRTIDTDYLESFFGEATYEYDAKAIEAGLADPVWELLDRGGKRWRSVLFFILVQAFEEDPMEFRRYACVPELFHTGTILVDDVEDGATLRRGEPAIHREYGHDVALNAGNALYFIPFRIIKRNSAHLDASQQLSIYEMLADELNRTHLGQGMDIHWHNWGRTSVTEKQFLEMCACKTGCLARIVARLAAIVTEQDAVTEAAVATYCERLSIAFQIIDDVLDVEHSLGEAGEFGKAFGNDVREGKTTLLVIHALENADPDQRERLLSILDAAENDNSEIREALDIFQETGGVEYGRRRAEEFADAAVDALDGLALVDDHEETLRAFPGYVLSRQR